MKQKRDAPAAARELYVSPLFRKGRAYAEHTGAPWFVLSAEHGLVAPDTALAPYDLRLSKTSTAYRRAWGEGVVADLSDRVGGLHGKVIEIHAGEAYVGSVRGLLHEAGATVIEPLAGLRLGPRLSWYGSASSAGRDLQPPTADPAPEVEELIALLTRADSAVSPADFLASGGADLRAPGLYSWWVDQPGASDLSRGLGHPVPPGLIYAGLAGATRSKSGRKSKNTLWGRIRTMHLGGRHEFSTFRLSLGSVLSEAEKRPAIDEEDLTRWMHEHLRVIAIPVSDADTLGAVETEVLTLLDPPLNLDKVPRTDLRRRLSELRRTYSNKRPRSAD